MTASSEWAAAHAGVGGCTDRSCAVVTHVGGSIIIFPIAIIAVGCLLWAGHRRLALFLATVVVGQWAIANWRKSLSSAPVQNSTRSRRSAGSRFPQVMLRGGRDLSCPCHRGHAVLPRWRRPLLVALAVAIAEAVAASRSLFGVHWFSDVIGGLLLGWTWCWACAVLYDVLSRRPAPSASTSDYNRVPVGHLTTDDLLRKRVTDLGLDEPPQRPRAEPGRSPLGEPAAGRPSPRA